MSTVNASFPASVEVDGFTVYKLRLSEYALVFDKLQKLPGMLAEFEDVTNAKLLAALPRLVASALPEVIAILAISTRKDVNELEESMDLKTAVRCLKALFQVNDFFGVWEELQTIKMPTKAAKSPEKST